MDKIYKSLLGFSAILGLLAIGILIFGNGLSAIGSFVIGALVCLAIGGLGKPKIKQMAFTIWVFAAVAVGMFYPQYFRQIGDFKFTSLIVPLIQLIMFTMGYAYTFICNQNVPSRGYRLCQIIQTQL
jgi:bile acid:Na+ symporter, BASS family